MKLSTIAKTSLALGILTTGVMTTYAQSADAEVQASVQTKISTEDLKTYYTKKPFELRDVKGDRNGDKVTVIDKGIQTDIDLLGNDKQRVNEEFLKSKIDVFVVGEGTSKQATINSIGGITKTNSKDFIDHVIKAPLTIVKKEGEFTFSNGLTPFEIKKEEISLKELDFKLRKQLIKDHGLYSGDKKGGTIVVKMNGEEKDKYTFELDKKLQDHRMGDVVDSKNIKEIIVEMK
ncbi:exotoxin beta-grasp domain-containing protein [Staphylococcus hyicus]|uniref:exotoxin beta-grasp domain-containing protein n=1 Tax=Staphylococcus hyicus TaxID=1284 RepID=UPI003132DDB5